MNVKISFGSIMKIANIIFLIVLENIVLDCGMGFFAVSLLVYMVFYMIFFDGLQNGISKMVTIRNSKGIHGNSKRIARQMLVYVLLFSVIFFLFGFLLLNFISDSLLGVSYPIPVIQFLCIVFLFTGLSDVLCGYQNGNGNGLVVNAANLLKIILPVIFSFFVLSSFSDYGKNVAGLLKNPLVQNAYAAMGIAAVYAVASILVFIVVCVLSVRNRNDYTKEKTIRSMDTRRSVLNGAFSMVLRMMLGNLFVILSIAASVFVYIHFADKAGIEIQTIYTNIGILFCKLLLPVLLVMILFGEYVTKECYRLQFDYRKEESKIVSIRTHYLIKNCFFMLIPPTIILTFLADPIVKILYEGQTTISPKFLQTGGFLLLLAGLAYTLYNILKSIEQEFLILGVQAAGFLIQLIFLLAVLPKSNGNSMLILYSFYLNFGIQVCAYFVFIMRIIRLDVMDIAVKVGKYAASGIVMMVLFLILDKFILMNAILLVLGMILGYLLYYLTLLALKGITKKDEAALKRTLNYYPVHFLRSRLRL